MKSLLLLSFGLFMAFSSFADLIGVVPSNGDSRIDLFSEAGVCLGNAKRAEFVRVGGLPVPGCWVVANRLDRLFVVFFDGEVAIIPVSSIKPPSRV